MKFSIRHGIVFWHLGNREGPFCNMPGWEKVRRFVIVLACIVLIQWIGSNSIGRIHNVFDSLCQMQLRFMHSGTDLPDEIAHTHFCSGFGEDIRMLGYLLLTATVAVPCALVGWWSHVDRSVQKISD